jgi:sugar lactone lactonase YvrE
MSKAISANLIKTIKVGNQLGEGVQWHQASQSIWWTDIEQTCLYSYSMATEQTTQHPMPERVGCFAFVQGQTRLLIAFASGMAFYDLANEAIDWLAQPELLIKGNRFNDGRVDRQGRFYAGTMVENAITSEQSAHLYCLDSNQQCSAKLRGIEISNGLCWSPDGKTMYHADSPTRTISQYDYSLEQGGITNPRFFAKTAESVFPDGSAVDAQGYLWNAQWGGSQVVRYSPDGAQDLILNVPASQPSCVCFAGEKFDKLIVTSAKQGLTREQMDKDSQAGHVFIYQLNGIAGLEESQYIAN